MIDSLSSNSVNGGRMGGKAKAWILMFLGLYVLWVLLDDDVEGAALLTVSPTVLVLLCSVTFVSFLLRFFRWHYLMKRLGYSLPAFWHFKCYISGFAFTATPGKVGELSRTLFLMEFGVPKSKSIALFFFDRFCDLVALLFFGLAYLLINGIASLQVVTLLLVLLVALPIALYTRLPDLAIDFAVRNTTSGSLHSLLFGLLAIKQTLLIIFDMKKLAISLLISLAAWALIGLELYIFLKYANHDLDYIEAMGAVALGLIAGVASLVPAGIGVNELVQSYILGTMGIPASVAKTAVFVTRVCTLWFAIGVGIISLLSLLRDRGRRNACLNSIEAVNTTD